MIKKIFFQLVFFNFFLLRDVFAAESGGMPQLNPEFWFSQIFWLTLTFSVALTGLEILVAFLQAYVFAILTCIYLNDALNLHH